MSPLLWVVLCLGLSVIAGAHIQCMFDNNVLCHVAHGNSHLSSARTHAYSSVGECIHIIYTHSSKG